jgi:acetyl esterase/lipase
LVTDRNCFLKFIFSVLFTWEPQTSLTPYGCDVNGKFAFIVHGWVGSKQAWQRALVEKLLKYRGGCVIVLNWGRYSDNINYELVVLLHWPRVTNLLTQKLRQLEAEGVSPDNIFMYGHSLGGRMVIQAGIYFGKGKIAQIDGQ